MYRVTSLQYGRTWFVFPNWAAGLYLIQRIRFSSRSVPSVRDVTVCNLKFKELAGR